MPEEKKPTGGRGPIKLSPEVKASVMKFRNAQFELTGIQPTQKELLETAWKFFLAAQGNPAPATTATPKNPTPVGLIDYSKEREDLLMSIQLVTQTTKQMEQHAKELLDRLHTLESKHAPVGNAHQSAEMAAFVDAAATAKRRAEAAAPRNLKTVRG